MTVSRLSQVGQVGRVSTGAAASSKWLHGRECNNTEQYTVGDGEALVRAQGDIVGGIGVERGHPAQGSPSDYVGEGVEDVEVCLTGA